MNPSEQHDQEDLERRLRDAFAAKALQISDADLDRDREDEVAAAVSHRRRTSTTTRIFAGIGAAAAAAAIAVVTVLGLHNGGKHEVVNGLPPAMTTSSASTTPSTTRSTEKPTTATGPSALNEPATPSSGRTMAPPSSATGTGSSSAPTARTKTSSSARSSALPGSASALTSSNSPNLSATASGPPEMSSDMPQSRPLGDQEYTGAVPLEDPSDGTTRMLSMPSDTTWKRTAENGNSLTVRITYLSTDIEAYWRQTLPGEGWVADGAGWKYPGTSYAVSPIDDKGSFTVTW